MIRSEGWCLVVSAGSRVNTVIEPQRREFRRDKDGSGCTRTVLADSGRVQVRAAILTLLGQRGDVVSLGSVVDRDGRTGTALALDHDLGGLPTRTGMVFDGADGHLFATEDTLTERAGSLNVQIPSVVSYTLYRTRQSPDG